MRVYLSPPSMGAKEMEFMCEAFTSNWIAPYGPALDAFEKEMAHSIGVESALAVTSGTAAIHLALRYLGVGRDDRVFCSDLTFIGSCSPVLYQDAQPVFIDSEPESFNMSPVALEKAFRWAEREGKPPKAVIIVDLYGESADYDSLLPICRRYGVPVIEDAAEAVGSAYKGRKCGSLGDIAVLSFNGNKIITTSGGGMVLCDDGAAVEKMRFWATQAKEPCPHYEHKEYGYNYRMSNICAAIGRGQLLFLEEKIRRRRHIRETYARALVGPGCHVKEPSPLGEPNCWLSLLVLADGGTTPETVVTDLRNEQIEARPSWKPMHMQPVFKGCPCFSHHEDRFVSEDVFDRCVCLPSGDAMSAGEQRLVIDTLKRSIGGWDG